jgi:hypothetical protein
MRFKHIGNKIQMGGKLSEIRKIFHDSRIMISTGGTANEQKMVVASRT